MAGGEQKHKTQHPPRLAFLARQQAPGRDLLGPDRGKISGSFNSIHSRGTSQGEARQCVHGVDAEKKALRGLVVFAV